LVISLKKQKKILWTELWLHPGPNSILHKLSTDSETHELIYKVKKQPVIDYESPEILMQLWKNRVISDLQRGSVIQLQNP